MKKIIPVVLSVLGILLCISFLVTISVVASAFEQMLSDGDAVSIATIDEMRIETEDATIYIKGFHTEVNNRQLQQLLLLSALD